LSAPWSHHHSLSSCCSTVSRMCNPSGSLEPFPQVPLGECSLFVLISIRSIPAACKSVQLAPLYPPAPRACGRQFCPQRGT
jgi:hypothetical protein